MSKLVEKKDYSQVLHAMTKGLKENTKRAYNADITEYMQAATSWSTEAAKRYFRQLAKDGYAPTTIRRKRATLSLFAKHLVERKEIPENPFHAPSFRSDLRTFIQTAEKRTKRRSSKPGAHYIREEKLKEMLASTGTGLQSLRDKAVLLLGAGEGLRRSEMSALTWDDIKIDDKGTLYLLIKGAKSGTGTVRLFPAVISALKALEAAYQKANIRSKYVLVSLAKNDSHGRQLGGRAINEIVRKYALLVQAENANEITAHDLRHTFAVSLHKKKVGIATISKMLRHSDVKITLHYLSTLNVIEDPALEAIANDFMVF